MNTTNVPIKEWSWIGDILFERPNRSVKHIYDGYIWLKSLSLVYNDHFRDLLILRELAEWNDIEPRLVRNLLTVIVFCIAIVFNFILMLMSFTKKRRSFHYKWVSIIVVLLFVNWVSREKNILKIKLFRSRCIIAHLAFTNIVLSCGFLLYTFLIDIYYDVDSFNTLIDLNAFSEFAQAWPLAKVI